MKIRTVAAAAALIALVGAGCSDDPADTPGSALPASDSATTAAPTTDPTTPAAPSGTASPTAAAPSTPESTPVSTRCHTSELGITIGEQDAAAGNRYATVTLRNTSRRTCTVYGFGGLQPLDANHKAITVTLERDAQQGAPRLVRLAPGAGVGRTIHWTAIPSGNATTCPKGAYAEITPPDETDHVTEKYQFADICGAKMDGTPFGVTRG